MPKFRRVWAMPNRHTFLIKPIREEIESIISGLGEDAVIVDPFAGYNSLGNITNDLNPDAPTTHHMDALEFLMGLGDESADCILIDPPYSPRQVAECYRGIGRNVTMQDTQLSRTMSMVKKQAARILRPGGVAVCCGWNSNGIGKSLGFRLKSVLIVPHGGGHNDTIVTSETKGVA